MLDGGSMPLARSLYAEAGQLAAHAGDTLLTVHTLTLAGGGPGMRCRAVCASVSGRDAGIGELLEEDVE